MKFSGPEPLLLTAQEELTLLKAAQRKQPADRHFRLRLARQLIQSDYFEEVIDLLAPLEAELSESESIMLGRAFLNLERPAETARAYDVFALVAKRTSDKRIRATAFAEMAKAKRRTGEVDEARAFLDAALECDPENVHASKRLASLELTRGRPVEVLAHVRAMKRLGISHTRMLSNEMLALAATGKIDAARNLLGLDWAFEAAVREDPEDWREPVPYHRALAEEIAAHPGVSLDRYGAASNDTRRVDDPLLRRSSAVAHFSGLVEREFARYLERLPHIDHPILANRPGAVRLRFWSVITEADGWEGWHMHQGGWISGVYYAQVPAQVEGGERPEGCLEIGITPEIVGQEIAALFGTQRLRPQPGMMAFFPSFTYHRTYAHRADTRRICVAFDLAPM